ncbi:MAG: response regulator transcription factor [Betaproteobacteria bacterium]|nr:response regulator transcription factor [Betaproteobacteria bacterium]
MAHTDAVDQGRSAFARRQWRTAYARLSAADRDASLDPTDLERLATAAYLVGQDDHAVTLWARVHHDWIDRSDLERAVYWGYWLSIVQLVRGEPAQATGWLARARRLDSARHEVSAVQGYGEVVGGLLAMGSGDLAGAAARFAAAVVLAERFDDSDLLALGLLGQGQALIMQHELAEGTARLDEAMLGITAGKVSPVLAGIVYCAVILTCQRTFDLARAHEWTRQLDVWCAAQPDLTPFRGECLVHRSQVLQARGDWSGALDEAAKARDHLAARSEVVVGRACYQQGELHRLRGEFDAAEQMFRDADRYGCEPQPGISLLRLATGEVDGAAAAIRRAVDAAVDVPGPTGGLSRPRLLGPLIEILLALGDATGARKAADELAAISAKLNTPYLAAASAHSSGAVLLAEGETQAAQACLREAWMLWQQLEMPYESACVRVLLGQVCRRLDDRETARMHFDAARAVFQRLDAAPALAQLERLASDAESDGALTQREREVLALVAAGQSNRRIAAALAISEHTVARHLSNIFDKLGVNSRTAATTYAHTHKLI